jgi:hypothetical protein
MKRLLLFLAIINGVNALQAQCTSPQSQIDIHGNNIRARVLNGGDLFTSFDEGQFIPNPNPNAPSNPSTIFAAGLWMGGIDPAGNLKLAMVDYRSNSSNDYSAGPLSEDGQTTEFVCENWDRHFRVTGDQIAGFLAALPLTQAEAIAQFPSVMGWPGRGNAFFAAIWGFDLPFTPQALAPFFDADNDGVYNPLVGDYPVVALRNKTPFVPAEIIWCVFNDQNGGAPHTNSNGKAIQAEVQQTVWAFSCTDNPVLNNTIFTSHKIINRATENIDSFFIAFWVDVDLGCYQDDYVGCDTATRSIFAYNQDALDGQPGTTCSGTATFGDAPPVQTITFLNQPLSKFMMYNSNLGSTPVATTDPSTPNEYYNYLTGSWRDGTPLTYGDSGYNGSTPTDHAFPGNPADPAGWSMCSASLPSLDRRVIASSALGRLQPGQVEELTSAWTVHYNTPPPCNLGNALNDVSALQALYDNDFVNLCSAFSKAPELPADSLDLFPNPTSGDAVLRYGAIRMEEIRIFDATGKLVQTLNNLEKGETTLQLRHLPAGMYTLRLFSDQGNVTKKLAVVR